MQRESKVKERKKILRIINRELESLLLLLAVILLFTSDYNYLLVLPLFPLFALFKYVHWYDRKRHLNIPVYYYTLGLFAVYLAIAGEFYLELYYKVIFYDKILHFFISLYLAMVVCFFLKQKVRFRYFFAVLIVLGIGAIYELIEFAVDSVSGTTLMQGVVIHVKELMGSLEDTMKDLSYAFVGSICGAWIAHGIEKRAKKYKTTGGTGSSGRPGPASDNNLSNNEIQEI